MLIGDDNIYKRLEKVWERGRFSKSVDVGSNSFYKKDMIEGKKTSQ